MVESGGRDHTRNLLPGRATNAVQGRDFHGDLHFHAAPRPAAPVPVRVRDARPLLLGVHRPIHVNGADPDALPAYVPRDTDLDPRTGIRARIRAAAAGGGFVVVVGESSVGKTRSLYEAVRELLPDWSLVQPTGAEPAARPPDRLVIWLDELQNHVNAGLTAATAAALVHGGAVLVGTLWPHHLHRYTAPPPPSGAPDPYQRERDLLKLADVIHLATDLTAAERRRARAAAATDPRLQAALETKDFGLVQTIAAAPQLIDRWNTAGPYARAVLVAAIDATRLGALAPIPAGLLRSAAPGYCSPDDRARAPSDWFERAMAYAAEPLRGATAALIPTAEPGAMTMGGTGTYRIADYLLQHVVPQRRAVCPPATFWNSCLDHLTDPADLRRVGANARNRLRYRHAEPLLRRAAAAGDGPSASLLAHLVQYQDRVEDAIAILKAYDDGTSTTALRLARLLERHGDIDQAVGLLRARTDGPMATTVRHVLTDLLAGQGRLDELRARAGTGDPFAVGRLAELLAMRGELDAAMGLLREHRKVGHTHVTHRLAELLARHGDIDELRILADTDGRGGSAAEQLARLLSEQGKFDELRARADAGDQQAARRLADVLAERSSIGELRARAGTDGWASDRLAGLLIDQGDLDAAMELLRADVDANRMLATYRLAELLAAQGDLDELRARAHGGDAPAADALARLLGERGEIDEAADLLAASAVAENWTMSTPLIDLLAVHERLDALWAQVDTGNAFRVHGRMLVRVIAGVLARQGRDGEAERLKRYGLTADGEIAFS